MGETAAAVDSALERLRGELAGFDPTLAAGMERSAQKIRYQLARSSARPGARRCAATTAAPATRLRSTA